MAAPSTIRIGLPWGLQIGEIVVQEALSPASRSCDLPVIVLHFCPMSTTITVRLSEELAAWLEEAAARTGVSQGKLIRDQLEKARASGEGQSFLRLAGAVDGRADLSKRKGFSRS
jgi:predicted DNA binding CopG/RHH family protein